MCRFRNHCKKGNCQREAHLRDWEWMPFRLADRVSGKAGRMRRGATASNGISFREALRKRGLLKEVRACFDQTHDGVSSRFGRGPAHCDALARAVGPQGAGPY